jgi:hypothetical protein
MKRSNQYLVLILILLLSIISGCASTKSYRDAEGVLKTDTRSTTGIRK